MWRSSILFGVIAAALLFAALACGGGSDEEPEATPSPTAEGDSSGFNRLFSDTRSHLSVCVAGTEAYEISDEEVDDVHSALEAGLAEVDEVPSEFGDWEVVAGCPAPVETLGTPLKYYPGFDAAHVDVPSEHMVFVYFVPEDVYHVTFGDEAYTLSTEEMVCEGDVCVGVTLGLYVPATVTSGLLKMALLDGLVLLPREPEPEQTLDWTSCERGTPPHPDYPCEGLDDWTPGQEEQ